MFTAAVYIMAPNWEQHVFPKVNKKTKVGSIHTVDISQEKALKYWSWMQ